MMSQRSLILLMLPLLPLFANTSPMITVEPRLRVTTKQSSPVQGFDSISHSNIGCETTIRNGRCFEPADMAPEHWFHDRILRVDALCGNPFAEGYEVASEILQTREIHLSALKLRAALYQRVGDACFDALQSLLDPSRISTLWLHMDSFLYTNGHQTISKDVRVWDDINRLFPDIVLHISTHIWIRTENIVIQTLSLLKNLTPLKRFALYSPFQSDRFVDGSGARFNYVWAITYNEWISGAVPVTHNWFGFSSEERTIQILVPTDTSIPRFTRIDSSSSMYSSDEPKSSRSYHHQSSSSSFGSSHYSSSPNSPTSSHGSSSPPSHDGVFNRVTNYLTLLFRSGSGKASITLRFPSSEWKTDSIAVMSNVKKYMRFTEHHGRGLQPLDILYAVPYDEGAASNDVAEIKRFFKHLAVFKDKERGAILITPVHRRNRFKVVEEFPGSGAWNGGVIRYIPKST